MNIKYDPKANPAINFGAFSKKVMNKAEELELDKIEFIDEYIEYLKNLIDRNEAKTYDGLYLPSNTSKDFLEGLIKYLGKIKERYQVLASKEATKEKLEREKEELRDSCKEALQRLSEKTPSLEERIKQLKELFEERKKEKGKYNKILLEEIQKELDKVQKLLIEERKKEREIKDKRDDWHEFLNTLITDKKDLSGVLEHLYNLEEQYKTREGLYNEIALEEIEKLIKRIETGIKKEEKETDKSEEKENIDKNRKYLTNIIYFTNGFASIAQSPLISEFGRTFSTDISEYERFSELNNEIRGEARTTEEDQIRVVIKNKINNLPVIERRKVIEEINAILSDGECEKIIHKMKEAETKYRYARKTLNGGYELSARKKEDAMQIAKKDMEYAEKMKQSIETGESPAALKLNKVLASDIATDILILKLREREIEKRKPIYAER